MYTAEIDHVLMHLDRMRRNVREKMIDMRPADWDGIEFTDCLIFLDDLNLAYAAVEKLRGIGIE